MTEIRLYHAPRSPYSRLGLHKIARAGLDAVVMPFTGPPDGVPFSDPVANPVKLSYLQQDVFRMTVAMDLPLAVPDPFDVDFKPSQRACVAALIDGFGLSYAIAIADARWGEGKNVSELPVLQSAAESIGWSASRVADAQTDQDVTSELARHRQLINEDGVFGVPFAVSGPNKYWGHDRFDLLIQSVNP